MNYIMIPQQFLFPMGISFPASDYHVDNVELLDNDDTEDVFLLDNDGDNLLDN